MVKERPLLADGGGFRLKISEKTLGGRSEYNLKVTLCSNLIRGVISLHVACRSTIACDVLSQSSVCSTANFLREIPHILSCFYRATRQTDYTKYASLADKPQNEFTSY